MFYIAFLIVYVLAHGFGIYLLNELGFSRAPEAAVMAAVVISFLFSAKITGLEVGAVERKKVLFWISIKAMCVLTAYDLVDVYVFHDIDHSWPNVFGVMVYVVFVQSMGLLAALSGVSLIEKPRASE